MATELSRNSQSRLRRLVELRWQREVIARWLTGLGTPVESQSQLEEMFAQVTAELQELEGTPVSGQIEASPEPAPGAE